MRGLEILLRIGVLTLFVLVATTVVTERLGGYQSAYAAVAHAQTLSKEDVWREQNKKKFEEWRAGIPDYEKRLYDRVKKINSRLVRLTNIVVAGFILILIFAPMGIYLMLTRAGVAVSGAVPTTSISERAPPEARRAEKIAERARRDDAKNLQKIKRQHRRVMEAQDQLRRLLADVRGSVQEYEENLDLLNRDKKRIGSVIDKCTVLVERLDQEMEEATRTLESNGRGERP